MSVNYSIRCVQSVHGCINYATLLDSWLSLRVNIDGKEYLTFKVTGFPKLAGKFFSREWHSHNQRNQCS